MHANELEQLARLLFGILRDVRIQLIASAGIVAVLLGMRSLIGGRLSIERSIVQAAVTPVFLGLIGFMFEALFRPDVARL